MKGTLLLELKLLPPHVWADDLLKQLLPRALPAMASPDIQCWGLKVQGYPRATRCGHQTALPWLKQLECVRRTAKIDWVSGRSGEEGSKLC